MLQPEIGCNIFSMNYEKTTMIPNAVLDNLSNLSEKELKVLLVIFRQTIGWITKDGKRKHRDWISHRYFINKTGLSRKSITQAISLLIKKELIIAETVSEKYLQTGISRKGQMRIYYSCTLLRKVKSASTNRKNLHTTKLTDTKLNRLPKKKITSQKKLSDIERYYQILRQRGYN